MNYRLLGLFFILYCTGCRCPETRAESAVPHRADAPASSPAAVRQNFSYIEGVIDSVVIIDEFRFQLVIRIVAARAGSGTESLAEPGQQLVVTPDGAAERQARLSVFRAATPGDTFSGSIVRSPDGLWLLLDAEPR